MDAIPSDFLIQNRLAQQQSADQVAQGQLDRNAFLNLLLTQLENQDPLSPMQDHEFVAQLATFSSLEQLESLNSAMQASLLMNQSVNNSLATNLIGKEVLADGSTLTLGETGAIDFQVDVDSEADLVVLVRDSEGNLVRRIELGEVAAGATPVEWDGLNEAGQRADSGEYGIEVLAHDTDGNTVASSIKIRALVTGIRFEGGVGYLLIGDQTIALSSVLEVFAPTNG